MNETFFTTITLILIREGKLLTVSNLIMDNTEALCIQVISIFANQAIIFVYK